MFSVTELPDARGARHVNATQLTRWKPNGRETSIFRHQLRRGTGRPHQLTTLAGMQLDVVDHRAYWHRTQLHRVAWADLSTRSVLDRVPDTKPDRSQDVLTSSVLKANEGDARSPIRVVFDGLDVGGNTNLRPLPVNHAIETLVPSTPMTHGDLALIVAPGMLLQTLCERLVRAVGRDLAETARFRAVIWRTGGWSILFVLALAVTGGVFVARRVLTRIDQMTETTRLIMAGDFSGRLTVSGTDDELDRLAQSLNTMLERIQELMKGLKEVSDNIAHDLKTPLTRLRNSAEEALRNSRSVDDLRLALDHVIDEADGLIKLFNALLMIARAEAGGAFDRGDNLDLSAIAHDVAELYEPLADEAGMKLIVKANAPIEIRGSRELLGQALANLIDNAIKYSASREQEDTHQKNEITVAVERRNDLIELSVADRGPGIAEEDRGRVLDRFVRLETSRTRPGSGLGLSLAAAIARLHNGTLKLEDHAPGLRVVLSLPVMSKT